MKWLFQHKLIYVFAIVKFALPFILQNSVYELHRDEYLYYEQGQHLSLGYLECPPLIGWMAHVSFLLGGGFFWIKFWPCLVGALTVIVAAAITKELGGTLLAQSIAAFTIILSAYLRTNFLFQPNMLDIFFWSLSAYYLLKYINTQEKKHLFFLSISLALGWWGKSSVLFFITSLFISIILSKHRKMLQNFSFWKAVALGIVLIIPNIFWQWNHNWPLIHHMQELNETQLKYINKTDFLKEQLLMLFPVAFVWIGGLIWLLKNVQYRIIAFIYIGIIALLMIGSGKAYYALGAYPMLLAAGGVWLEKLQLKMKWVAPTSFGLILLLSLPFVPILIPMQEPKELAILYEQMKLKELGLLKWEDQKNHPLQQDFADMLGWRELAEKSEKFYTSLPLDKKSNTSIYCRNYGQAGALKYYAVQEDFKQKVFCDNGTFLLWIKPSITFKHLILIGRNMPEKDDGVFNHFEKITVVDSVTNPLSRQYRDKIIFFENADSVAVTLTLQGLMEMKKQFQRKK